MSWWIVTFLFDINQFIGKLQYLDQDDLKKYLVALNDGDHLMHDHSFLRLLHERYLKKNKSDKRKESEYVSFLCLSIVEA